MIIFHDDGYGSAITNVYTYKIETRRKVTFRFQLRQTRHSLSDGIVVNQASRLAIRRRGWTIGRTRLARIVILPHAEPGAAQAASLRQPGLGCRVREAGRFGLGEHQIIA